SDRWTAGRTSTVWGRRSMMPWPGARRSSLCCARRGACSPATAPGRRAHPAPLARAVSNERGARAPRLRGALTPQALRRARDGGHEPVAFDAPGHLEHGAALAVAAGALAGVVGRRRGDDHAELLRRAVERLVERVLDRALARLPARARRNEHRDGARDAP